MFIEVQFKRKNGEYSGSSYTYNCTIPVKTGDFVLAPTQRGDTPAKVVGIGIPYEEINPAFRDSLRTISQIDESMKIEPEEEENIPSLFEEET